MTPQRNPRRPRPKDTTANHPARKPRVRPTGTPKPGRDLLAVAATIVVFTALAAPAGALSHGEAVTRDAAVPLTEGQAISIAWTPADPATAVTLLNLVGTVVVQAEDPLLPGLSEAVSDRLPGTTGIATPDLLDILELNNAVWPVNVGDEVLRNQITIGSDPWEVKPPFETVAPQ